MLERSKKLTGSVFGTFAPQKSIHPTILFVTLLPLTFWAWLPEVPVYLFQYAGRDPHWKLTLYYALEKGLVFGRDIVFTYGPLGFLEARLGYPGYIKIQLLFDLLVFLLFFRAVYITARLANNWMSLLLIWIGLLASGYYSGAPQSSLLLLAIQIIYLQIFLFRWTLVDLVLAGLIAIFLFFTKFGVGVAAVFIFLLVLEYALFSIERRLAISLINVSCLVVAGIGVFTLPIDLVGYVKSGLSLVSGYSEAMALSPKSHFFQSIALILIGFYAVYFIYSISLKENSSAILHKLILGLALFVLFKQGFVRADAHMLWFMQFVPFICIGVLCFNQSQLPRILVLLALICQIVPLKHEDMKRVPGLKKTSIKMYKILIEEELPNAFNSLTARSKLPKDFSSTIGDSSVDIFRYASADLILAGKNYTPRPVFQTYASYNPYLDSLNAEHFSKDERPDFVVYDYHSIDRRFSFADEVKTKLALLENYSLDSVRKKRLLLKKRSTAKEFVEKRLKVDHTTLGQAIQIPSEGNLLLLRIEARPKLVGRFQAFALRASELEISFHFADGSSEIFKAVRGQLEEGILISPFVNSSAAARNFFSHSFSRGKRVTSVVLRAKNLHTYQPIIRYEIVSLEASKRRQ